MAAPKKCILFGGFAERPLLFIVGTCYYIPNISFISAINFSARPTAPAFVAASE